MAAAAADAAASRLQLAVRTDAWLWRFVRPADVPATQRDDVAQLDRFATRLGVETAADAPLTALSAAVATGFDVEAALGAAVDAVTALVTAACAGAQLLPPLPRASPCTRSPALGMQPPEFTPLAPGRSPVSPHTLR